MIIDNVTILKQDEDNYFLPNRIHMMVSEGIVLSSIPKTVNIGDWDISYYNENAISFYSHIKRYEIDTGFIGSRIGYDLLGAYVGTPYFDYIGGDPEEFQPREETVLFEGQFNADNVFGLPVYPITVFTPDQMNIGRELFMPVPYINDVLYMCNSEYTLSPSIIPAYNGEIVFELDIEGH